MIDPLTSFTGFADPNQKTAKKEFDMTTFLRLLTVQLSTQNPLEPMNDRDFFAQIAQLGQVDGISKLQSSMETSQAASLIGKKVTALQPLTESKTGKNELVVGTVSKMMVRDGVRMLSIKVASGGVVEVPLANVREIEA